MAVFKTFEEINAWQNARVLVKDIYAMTRCGDFSKDYGLRDQIQRAAVSICSNIAEGFEYNSDSVFIRYLNIAKGSCSEVKSMLYLCEDLGYCSPNQRVELQAKVLDVSSGIYNMIAYLSQPKPESK